MQLKPVNHPRVKLQATNSSKEVVSIINDNLSNKTTTTSEQNPPLSPVSRGQDVVQLQPPETPKEEVKYYDVPLSKDLQKYIWDLSKQYAIPYELIIATIRTESNFDSGASNGIAKGLMQLNTSDQTFSWLARECGISNPDPYNPFQNVQMGVYYLNYLKLYWLSQDVTEHTLNATLISYNDGLGGAQKYIRDYGFTSSYTTKVFGFRDELIQTGGITD